MKRFIARHYAAIAAILAAAIGAVIYRARRSPGIPPLKTVSHVDLDRYAGRWHEIARYSLPFEQDSYGPTYEFTRRPDGFILVLYSCRRGSFEGPLEASEGIAKVTDSRSNAKLNIQFLLPFTGDFWIIDIDRKYQHCVAANPGRTALWILSRSPQMDEETYASIVDRLKKKGFDPARIRRSPQPARELAAV